MAARDGQGWHPQRGEAGDGLENGHGFDAEGHTVQAATILPAFTGRKVHRAERILLPENTNALLLELTIGLSFFCAAKVIT